jgi:UDP-N-acetylmuramyl pentapeptide phosphotransferase/UDP-N-acetylglucosamine-1-phosphate transferase
MFKIEEWNIVGGFLAGLIITWFFIPTIIRIAHIKKFIDKPDTRKAHTVDTPMLGGIAIFAGLLIAMLVFVNHNSWNYLRFYAAGLFILFFVGLKDDILLIEPLKKLGAQLIAVLLVCVPGGLSLSSLHGFMGIWTIPPIPGTLLTIFVMLVIINAFNLIDGIDGLASGIGIIASVTFGILFLFAGDMTYTILSFTLAGTLIAYFRFNISKGDNKIFMGDTGSLLIGLIMAILAVRFNEFHANLAWGERFVSAPAISIGILIVPLFDTLRIFAVRVLRGKSPFQADRNHVHHRMLMLGLSHLQSTGIILGINLLFIAFVLLADPWGIGTLMLIITPIAGLLSVVPLILFNMRNREHSHQESISEPAGH